MKKEIKIVAIVLVALIVFLSGFGLGATKGINIQIGVSSNNASGAVQAGADVTQPPVTQPPVTQPPATEPAATDPATPATDPATPAADPATPATDPAAPATDDTAASATGVPSTPAEVVAKYNEVINNAKKEQNVTMHKVGSVSIECTECSVSFLQGTVNNLLQSFMTPTDKTITVTNGVATDQDGNNADMNAYITPNGREAALQESYVASATATPSGDGYTLNITLNAETSTFDGTNTVNPVGHESCLDPLNLATLELPANAKITEASMTYPGATLTAEVNGAGKITKLTVHLPLEGTGTGKLGASLSLGLKGSMDDTYDFTY